MNDFDRPRYGTSDEGHPSVANNRPDAAGPRTQVSSGRVVRLELRLIDVESGGAIVYTTEPGIRQALSEVGFTP